MKRMLGFQYKAPGCPLAVQEPQENRGRESDHSIKQGLRE